MSPKGSFRGLLCMPLSSSGSAAGLGFEQRAAESLKGKDQGLNMSAKNPSEKAALMKRKNLEP